MLCVCGSEAGRLVVMQGTNYHAGRKRRGGTTDVGFFSKTCTGEYLTK